MKLMSKSGRPIVADVRLSVEHLSDADKWYWEFEIDDALIKKGEAADLSSAVGHCYGAFTDWLNSQP